MRVRIAAADQTPARLSGGEIGYFVCLGSRLLGRPIVVDEWRGCDMARIEFDETSLKPWTMSKEEAQSRLEEIVKRMAEQMHVTITLENQTIETWVLEPKSNKLTHSHPPSH
jgi:hypothetical protein